MDMKEKMNLQNEADFPEYLENVKDEEEPEMIDYKAMDLTEDEKMEYEMEKARKEEDYGINIWRPQNRAQKGMKNNR